MKKIISLIVCAALVFAAAAVTLVHAAEAAENEKIAGDINNDGEANNKDVVELFRYVSGDKKLEDDSAYDFNGDSEVNNKDVVELFRYLSAGEQEEVTTGSEKETESEPESETEPEESVTEPESETDAETVTDSDTETEPEESKDDSAEESVTEPESSESEPESVSESEPESESESETETEAETIDLTDEKYYVWDDLIYMEKPEGYTFYDSYQGMPSGVKDGVQDGTCFFNYQTQAYYEPMDENTAVTFLEAMRGQIGDYSLDNFETVDLEDGVVLTKLDFTWGNQIMGHTIVQSLVRVHFEDDCVAVIMFAVWEDLVPEGQGEFDDMIATIGVCPDAI